MINLGLSSKDLAKFHQTLITGYQLDIVVQVLDLNHKVLSDLSTKLNDGQVNIDGDADVTRSLTLSLNDPDYSLGYDSRSPSEGALFLDRMIKIIYVVTSEDFPKGVNVPLFCGPVINVSRDDTIINIDAQGKEALLLPPTVAWYAHKYGKGWTVPSLVRNILSTRGGETKFDFPEWTAKTTREYNLLEESIIWNFCKAIVGPRSLQHLFYDGRGYARLRSTPKSSTFTFTEDHLTGSMPDLKYDTSGIRNSVLVLGATPTGKPRISSRLGAPKAHPLSSWSLGRNGVQRIMLEKVEDDSITTKALADAKAQSVLDSVLMESVSVTFVSKVIPHLEPEDIYTLKTDSYSVNQRIKQISIPLKADGVDTFTMTVGFTAKRSVMKRKK